MVKKQMPKELKGLWNYQYKPLEKKIFTKISSPTKKKWNELSYVRKMEIIDNFKQRGKL